MLSDESFDRRPALSEGGQIGDMATDHVIGVDLATVYQDVGGRHAA